MTDGKKRASAEVEAREVRAMSMSSPFSHAKVEQVREYWNRRPCNVRHSPEPVGTRAYFDQVRERKYFVEPHIPRFAEFERWKNKRVLEIGCGIEIGRAHV